MHLGKNCLLVSLYGLISTAMDVHGSVVPVVRGLRVVKFTP
jgi:hypothetical protein